MQMKKLNLFKTINIIVFFICATSMAANCVNTNILNDQKVISSINNNIFEYQCAGNEFSIIKNNELIGKIPFNQDVHFKANWPFIQCNALAVLGKSAVIASIDGIKSKKNWGQTFVSELQSSMGAIGGAAVAGAATMVELPGGAVVSATLGGAGEAAAVAAAAEAELLAGGTAAVIANIATPILWGAIGFGAIA